MSDFNYTLPNKDMVEGRYYKVISNTDDDFIMIGKALSMEVREGDNYWAEATFISPNRPVKFQKNKRWCYKNEARTFLPAEDHEIEWLDYCIENDKYVSKSIFNQIKHNHRLKWDNLIKGEYYKFIHSTQESQFSIVRYGKYYITPNASENKFKFREWDSRSFTNTSYRDSIEKPSDREIQWLQECVNKNKFIPYDDFKSGLYKKAYSPEEKLEKLPTHGWCDNPSKEVRRYIFDNFNDKKMFRPGKMGIAWNNRSAWKIEGSSSYKQYTNKELERLLPTKTKAVCVDLEAGGLTWQPSNYVEGWKSMVAAIDPAQLGINENRQGVIEEDPHIFPYLRDYQIREMEMMKLRHEEGMRKAMFGYPGDRIVSSGMAILGHMHTPKKQDEFTQQDTVLVKNKKKKRKLISC